MIIGGSTPLIAQAILGVAGPWGVAAFFALLSVLTLVGIIGMRRVQRSSGVRGPTPRVR